MFRFFPIVLCSLPLFVGCGNDGEPMANRSAISSSEKKESQVLVNSPTDVVSQFLDEVKGWRGFLGPEPADEESSVGITANRTNGAAHRFSGCFVPGHSSGIRAQ